MKDGVDNLCRGLGRLWEQRLWEVAAFVTKRMDKQTVAEQTGEYYSATKSSAVLTHATTRMNLGHTLSE